MQIKGLRF